MPRRAAVFKPIQTYSNPVKPLFYSNEPPECTIYDIRFTICRPTVYAHWIDFGDAGEDSAQVANSTDYSLRIMGYPGKCG
jgi:hypothetical protein